jgi:type I restriction enzyme, S subunit
VGDAWQLLRFDQLAENVTDRVDDPAAAGVERYVGLEHLDPGALVIERWGTPSDVQSTKLRFKPGDVIFGKRRVYQRKLGVARFEGICSAHAMVLRAKTGSLLPSFLPLLMQSDEFMNRALRISVGSLSPTINWTTLAGEMFYLPPTAEQARAIGFVTSTTGATNALQQAAQAARKLTDAVLEWHLRNSEASVKKLGSLLAETPRNGFSAPEVSEPTGRWVLSLSAIGADGYQRGALKAVVMTPDLARATAQKGDLFITRSNTLELVGLVGIFNEERDDVSWPDTMIRLRPDEAQVLPQYLELYLRSAAGRRQIRSIAAGTSASMKKINAATLSSILVPVPSLDTQGQLVSQVSSAQAIGDSAMQRVDALTRMRQLAICQVTTHSGVVT